MASVLSDIANIAYAFAYQQSPILLTGGIAQAIPGQTLPIYLILEALPLAANALGALITNPSNIISSLTSTPAFANFRPLPGSTLISQQAGTHPFASQAIAAATAITQPLNVSLAMTCPATGAFGYIVKTATLIALTSALNAHINAGGLFTVLTPAMVYANCILTDLRDSSPGGDLQTQTEFTWTFTQPLVNQTQLGAVLNNMMSKINGSLPTSGVWSSIGSSIGGAVSSVQGGLTSLGNMV